MTKYSGQNHYIDSATGILRNLLGITDEAELEQTEAVYVATRSFQPAQQPLQGNFDLHMQAIHRHLFGDVYEWAGELRTVDIGKGGTMFAHHAHVASVDAPFEQLGAEKQLADMAGDAFSSRAAHYLGKLERAASSREGNGRAQREFISHLAQRNSYYVA